MSQIEGGANRREGEGCWNISLNVIDGSGASIRDTRVGVLGKLYLNTIYIDWS